MTLALLIALALSACVATPANAEEEGRRFYRVTLIDPDTIKSPTRVWL